MSRRGGIGAWLEIMRVSNAPTVVSNALAGAAVGLRSLPEGSSLPAGTAALVGTGIVNTYLAGMVLNDALDASTDAHERPRRPIPSGRITAARALFTGLVMLAVGTSMLSVASGPAWPIVLGALVLLYDLTHRMLPGAFLAMAACRGCVPVIAALAVSRGADRELLWWVAGGLAAYVAGVSLAARDEVRGFGASARFGAWSLPVTACAPLCIWLVAGVEASSLGRGLGIAAAVLASLAAIIGIRIARSGAARYSVPVAVGAWIGAIPLVDAAACFLLDRSWLGVACLGMWVLARALRPRFAAS